MKKRGLSAVIAVVILVLLVLVSIALVWTGVVYMIERSVRQSEACSDIHGKIEINNKLKVVVVEDVKKYKKIRKRSKCK